MISSKAVPVRDASRTKPSEVSEESGFGSRKPEQIHNDAMAHSSCLRNAGSAPCQTPYAEVHTLGLCSLDLAYGLY